MYSSPPVSGARVVTTVLSDAALAEQWYRPVNAMAFLAGFVSVL
jgi:aromatic-amino-acid transaminase